MKTQADLEARIRVELEQWFIRQCRDMDADYYLYYMEANKRHDGGIIICKDPPANPECKLAMSEPIRKGCTVEQNYNWLRLGICRRLPIME